VVPFGFELVGYQAIVGIDPHETPACQLGLVAGPLDMP